MRIFAAGVQAETNTFSPRPTGLQSFIEGGVERGDAALAGDGAANAAARLWRDRTLADGGEFFPSVFALAHPSGPVLQTVYEDFRAEILGDLAANGPIDVVLLFLHGAMVATECDSCEADLVEHVRTIVGADTIIGVELDPHCNLSERLVATADVVVLMKEYPHDDFAERADELYTLATDAKRGVTTPVSALFDCRMVGFYPTTREPMATFVRDMAAMEREPGILSVSFAHGFPWSDSADSGSRVLVISDGDGARAVEAAGRLGRRIYEARHDLLPRFATIDEALDKAAATPGLTVLADMGDNPGGGAPGDQISLLRAMLARGVTDAAFGGLWDPVIAALCKDMGVGARLKLRLGGKSGVASGDSIDVEAVVRAVKDDHSQGGFGASRTPLGLCAWIDVMGIDVVIASIRAQVFDPSIFTGLGIDVGSRRIAVVKSSQHFHAKFAPLAADIIQVATPGALSMDFAALPYSRKTDLAYYPRVPAPFGHGGIDE